METHSSCYYSPTLISAQEPVFFGNVGVSRTCDSSLDTPAKQYRPTGKGDSLCNSKYLRGDSQKTVSAVTVLQQYSHHISVISATAQQIQQHTFVIFLSGAGWCFFRNPSDFLLPNPQWSLSSSGFASHCSRAGYVLFQWTTRR
jgi:hypothetical protein